MAKRSSKIGFLGTFVVIFTAAGSGPVGVEGVFGATGSLLGACLAIVLSPLVVALPQAIFAIELSEKYPKENGGATLWLLKIYGSEFWAFCSTAFVIIYNTSMSALVAQVSVAYISTLEAGACYTSASGGCGSAPNPAERFAQYTKFIEAALPIILCA